MLAEQPIGFGREMRDLSQFGSREEAPHGKVPYSQETWYQNQEAVGCRQQQQICCT
jgi:hypothetical protein